MSGMRTIALRFNDPSNPFVSTIEQHRAIIDVYGSVWWGKRGKAISKESMESVLANNPSVILLTHNNKPDRWWGYVDAITFDRPDESLIPDMYRDEGIDCGTWFHITRLEKAPKDAMMSSFVVSTGRPLSQSSVHNPNPYFVIDYYEPRPSIYWE